MIETEIRTAYERYVSTVSVAEAAISWELSTWLWRFVLEHRPVRILDTGSGWSSALFRFYQKYHPTAHVTSVDDNPHWQAATVKFLEECGLRTDDVLLWNSFCPPVQHYDLALHDLGSMSLRVASFDTILSSIRRGGFLIVDDMHFPELNFVNSVRGFTSLPETKDRWGRFAGLINVGDK